MYVTMMGVWECPACDFERTYDDGKDAEKIIDHLVGHLHESGLIRESNDE